MLPDDNIGIVICDVVGKGVRASILMSSIRASLRAHASNMYDMYEVIRKVNHDLLVDTLTSDFATMFYCVLDTRARRLTYCGAGYLPPLLIRNGKPRYLKSEGGMIGVLEDMDFPVVSMDLFEGDVILMYTDGLVESMNFKGEEYGRQRAEEAACFAVQNKYSLDSVIRYCIWDMRRFAGLSQRADDLTMVGIRVK